MHIQVFYSLRCIQYTTLSFNTLSLHAVSNLQVNLMMNSVF